MSEIVSHNGIYKSELEINMEKKINELNNRIELLKNHNYDYIDDKIKTLINNLNIYINEINKKYTILDDKMNIITSDIIKLNQIKKNEIIKNISWDEYFILLCDVIKIKSKDPNKQVGSCLVSIKDKKILSTGYNSLKAGSNDNIDWTNRELVHELVIHSELNTLLYCNSKFEDAILYSSLSPCLQCIKALACSNIKKIIYKEEYRDIEKVLKICNFYKIDLIQFKK